MDIGVDTQQGADTYNIEIWLPSEADENYSSLKRTSEKVKDALIEENEKENKSEKGNEKVALVPKKYSSRDVVVNVSTDPAAKVVAAISFSEDFAKKYHFDEEQRKKNGNVAVLAMMGGILPVGKNFFRMGFSVETIAGILGDHVIHDRQVSHVFLIRVDNKLGDRFEEEFSRKIESQNCSLDILSIDADVKKATIGVLNENVRTNNTPTTTSAEFVKKKAADKKESSSVEHASSVEHVISQWLSGRIRSRSDEGLKSVVIYGYWEGYWDFVKEVLRCEDFRDDEDWLYVESNYPLLTPILYNKQSGSDLTNIVEIKEADKLNVKDSESYRIQEDFGQIPSVEKDDDGKIKINLNPSDIKGSLEETVDDTQVTGAKTKGFKDKTKKLTEDVHVQGLGRVRCFTGKLGEKENSFITFAKETVRLLRAAIRYAQDKLEKEKKQDDIIPYIRERICKFLVNSKFYASEHLGAFFFRKDGELFFPLYLYNGKLERQGIVRESCCKGDEFTKEAIADQLLQLSNSLNKITRAEIPRNLKVGNSDGAKKVFEEFSKIIADISKGIEIKFVSYYPNTEHLFYTWTDTQEGNVDKTERFINVSIFDDVCKNIQGVIQINLKDLDLEDNDAYRVYLVCERAGNIFDALTLAEWWNRQSNDRQATIIAGNKGWERCLLPVKAVVFAKSRIGKQDGQTDEGMSENEYKDIIDNANYAHYYRDCDGHESKFKFDEILSGLCKLLGCSGDNGNSKSDARFLYYIPEYIPEDNKPEGNNSYKTGGQGGIVMATCCKLSLFDLQIIENMVSRIFSKLKTCLAEHDVLLSNIKSAIGSIMSRNGSHNIGSHVLAALSHNVGTMPDDRVLYQYIQHRMDYIATVTTDFPSWTQPTKFIGNIMRTFLSQRHLLDHIVGSEGLKAWQFQNPNIDSNTKQVGCLRFHIRRQFGKDGAKDPGYRDFISYPDETILNDGSKVPLRLEDDVTLAIPGGVVGQHAFFTIIENIVRNAAKHDWSTPPKSTLPLKEALKNLDVYIDFFDDVENGRVRFRIWCQMSDVLDRVPIRKRKYFMSSLDGTLSINKLKQYLDKPEKPKAIPLHLKQHIELVRPLIGKDGKLRKENWGLAEIRISVGYLQRRAVAEIGALDLDAQVADMVVPVAVPGRIEGRGAAGSKLIYHLGYQFYVPKPREILFVVNKISAESSERNEFAKHGIYIKEKDSICSNDELSYEYVVLKEFGSEELQWKLPFRVLIGTKPRIGIPNPDMLPLLSEYDRCVKLLFHSTRSVADRVDQIRRYVMGRWCRYMQERKGLKGKFEAISRLQLVVQPMEKGQSVNSGKGLITNYDILKIVFDEEYNTAVRTFRDLNPLVDHALVSFIEAVRFRINRELFNPADIGNDCTVKELIALQLYRWTGESNWYSQDGFDKEFNKEGVTLLEKPTKKSIVELRSHLEERYNLTRLEVASSTSSDGEEKADDIDAVDFSAVDRECDNVKGVDDKVILSQIEDLSSARKRSIDDFIDYLEAIHAQTDVFLRKYEERIVTLPETFVAANGGLGDSQKSSGKKSGTTRQRRSLWKEGNLELLFDAADVDRDRRSVEYRRHFQLDNNARPKNADYIEPLSGTQTYLTELMQIDGTKYGLMTKLVESALLRVLVIDERVAKFYREHNSEISRVYHAMGIWVVDDKTVDAALDKEYNGRRHKAEMKRDMRSSNDTFVARYDNEEGCLLPLDAKIICRVQKVLTEMPDVRCEEILGAIQQVRDKDCIRARLMKALKTIKEIQLIIAEAHERFDVLIVHQGIIDKWLPKVAHDSLRMPLLMEVLKLLFPYVVITTGRGTPANIPESAHLLPFSTIETTLFKKYPEKLVLIDTIMNILKIGRREQ